MEAITTNTNGSAVLPSQASQNVTNSAPETTSPEVKTQRPEDEDFNTYLTKILGRTGQEEVNEEELFSSIIGQRLQEKDPEAATYYQEQVAQLSESMKREDGYVPVEDIAKAALRATVDAGKVSSSEAVTINALAFQAAQLDGDKLSLFDGRGETKAVSSMEEAMFKVKAVLDRFDLGDLILDPRALDTPSNKGFTPGTDLMGAGGAEGAEGVGRVEGAEAAVEGDMSEKQVRFTWKHEASDGNLAILLPTRLNGNIKGVSLYDSEGNLIEEGAYSKRTGDQRAVFRFDEPGGEYGKNIDAVVTLDNGDTLTYRVKDGNQRTYVPQDDFTKNKKYKKDIDEPIATPPSSGSGSGSGSTDSSGSTGSTGSTGGSGSSSGSGSASTGSGETGGSGSSSDSSGSSSSSSDGATSAAA